MGDNDDLVLREVSDGICTLTLNNPEPEDRSLFGTSVAVLNNTILVGAPGNHGKAGAVFEFEGPAAQP